MMNFRGLTLFLFLAAVACCWAHYDQPPSTKQIVPRRTRQQSGNHRKEKGNAGGGYLSYELRQVPRQLTLRRKRKQSHNIFARDDYHASSSKGSDSTSSSRSSKSGSSQDKSGFRTDCVPDPSWNGHGKGKGNSYYSHSKSYSNSKGKGNSYSHSKSKSKGKGSDQRSRKRYLGSTSKGKSNRRVGYGYVRTRAKQSLEAICPPGFIPKYQTVSTKAELRLAIQRWILSEGCDTTFGPTINDWDVSAITDFSSLFENEETFNDPIGNWETRQVTNMAYLFRGAKSFNQDIRDWDVSGVTDFSYMFSDAAFNQEIGGWNTESALRTDYMFYRAGSFNQDISNWYMGDVVTMEGMFCLAIFFDQNINTWDVSSVTNFGEMFRDAYSFNQPLSGWITSSAENFYGLFCVATSFNQNIGSWDVSSVMDFGDAFRDASSFNQDLCSWGDMFQAGVGVDNMFLGTGCPTTADPDLVASPLSPLCFPCSDFDVLYFNDFESPNRVITALGGTCTSFDITQVNDNFGTTANPFSQSNSVETIIVQSGDFVDPDGRAGMYALGMFDSVDNNDLLSLGFNLQGRRFVRVTLDVSPISCICSNFADLGCDVPNADAVLTINLIDDPTASIPVTGTVLDTASISAPKGGDEITFQWTRQTVVLDALGSDGQIAVNFDVTAGNYMVIDNLLIEAMDTPTIVAPTVR